MLAALRQPRWWALTLLAAALVFAMIELGMWQFRRSHERADFNDRVTSNTTAAPVEIGALLEPGEPVPDADEWRRVTIAGVYDVSGQVLVRSQVLDGAVGYDVVTPVVPDDGTPALLVNRGWVPAGASAAESPDVPAPPSGEVTVTGHLRPSEPAARSDDLPAGQTRSIDATSLAQRLPYVVYDGYADAVAGTPGVGEGDAYPRPQPLPELSAGPHLGYAIQWWLFSLVAVGGWMILLRNEARPATPAGPWPEGRNG